MKTQINTLVNGSKEVVGRVEDFKGGSNYALRTEIAAQVQKENKEQMSITVNGINLLLTRSESLSGKTVSFSSDLTKEQFASILGYESDITSYEASFSFTINNDMTCVVDSYAKKSENSQWKHRGYTNVAESLVIIK